MRVNNKEIFKQTINKGGLSFGAIVLLVVVIVFIMWVLTGGEKNRTNTTIDPSSFTPELPTIMN